MTAATRLNPGLTRFSVQLLLRPHIRHGHGNYIQKSDGFPVLPLMIKLYLQDSTPEMLMELRYIFDRNCSELAAERRTDEDLAAMRECIERLRRLSLEENPPWTTS